MKRFYVILAALTALLFLSCAALAENGSMDGISPRILTILAERGLENCAEDYIQLSQVEAPKGVLLDHTFVLISKDGIHHEVYHFTNDQTDENADQGWKLKAHYDSLAPQGIGMVAFQRHHANDRTGSDVSLYRDGQGFLIYRIDPEYEEFWMQTISIHVIDFKFQVVSWFDRSSVSSTEAYIRNGKIEFYDWDAGQKRGSVNLYTVFGLNTSFRSLPKSYQEAKATFSDPPEIPGGTLTAERIKFASNQKYAVYTGPSENYLRGGNGKASVSTNDWIQVFGKENGWIMIQYDITSDHMRIGWIREDALPRKTTVSSLSFGNHKAYTTVQCAITDDPLFSQTTIMNVPANSEVRWLATMGSWTYMEYETGAGPVRGFIRSDYLTRLTDEQAKSLAQSALLSTGPIAEREAVTAETLKSFRISCGYDTASGQWSVHFDSGRGYDYSVIVEDKSGMAWLTNADNI